MPNTTVTSLTPADIRRLMPTRHERSNKSTFGRVVAVCGSRGMSGAAYLAALAAYRVGCGIVEIVTPEDNRVILQTLIPEAILTCYNADSPDTSVIASAVSRADAVVVGCGLGMSPAAREVFEAILVALRARAVLDADALNLLAAMPHLWAQIPEGTIITPHPGEMSRLTQKSIPEILRDPLSTASELARQRNVVCVLKDHRSIISNGSEHHINEFGNSGMATAGSGDVLAGVIGGLLSQHRHCPSDALSDALSDAPKTTPSAISQDVAPSRVLSTPHPNNTTLSLAALGVLIHSLAGDAAAARLTEYSVMASDIASALPEVLVQNIK